jgi:hypothetical protein
MIVDFEFLNGGRRVKGFAPRDDWGLGVQVFGLRVGVFLNRVAGDDLDSEHPG